MLGALGIIDPRLKLIHIGHTYDLKILRGKIPLLLKDSDIIHVILSGYQYRVIEIKTEHPVRSNLIS